MDIVKIIGVGLIALIIIVIMRQYKPDFVIYVSIIAGAIIIFMSLDKLSGIINLLNTLSQKASMNSEFIIILLKITGIAFLTEFATSICKDSRRNSYCKQNRFWRKNYNYSNFNSNYICSFRACNKAIAVKQR